MRHFRLAQLLLGSVVLILAGALAFFPQPRQAFAQIPDVSGPWPIVSTQTTGPGAGTVRQCRAEVTQTSGGELSGYINCTGLGDASLSGTVDSAGATGFTSAFSQVGVTVHWSGTASSTSASGTWYDSQGFEGTWTGNRFTVNNTADATDANPGDGACDDGAGNCTLRAAVQEANAFAGADAITVPSGLYNLTLGGPGEDFAATGDLDVTDDLTITKGVGPTAPTIHANWIDRVFHIDPFVSGITVSLRSLDIYGGADSGLFGGGIFNRGTLTLAESTVSNNTSTGNAGGIDNQGTLTIIHSNIFHNTGTGSSSSGGIWTDPWSTLTIIDSVIWENTANFQGGGIKAVGTTTITNSTISGNSAGDSAGGIIGFGSTTLNNVTITGNTADSDGDGSGDGGGAIGGTVKNSIIAGNTDNSPGAEAPDCGSSGVTSQGYNLIGSNSGCPLIPTTGDLVGTGLSPIDPLLGPRQDNGGSTLTHALLTGSPAIDAGSPTTCEATDQRGTARPQGAACDIGAYETASPTTCPGFPPGETHDVALQLCFDDVKVDSDENGDLDYSAGYVCFTGTGKIWRSDPYRSGGYCTIDKELKSFYSTATVGPWAAWLKAGTEQGLGDPSKGTIVSLSTVPGQEFPADNDWKVYFEIGGLPTTGELQNCDLNPEDGTPDPATLVAQISAIPPYHTVHQGGVMPACDGDGTVRAKGEDAKGEVSPPVGGAVETLDGSAGPDSSADSSSGSGFNYTALGGALAAVAVAAAAGVWFARRRWAR